MPRLKPTKALRIGVQVLFVGVVLFFFGRVVLASRAQIAAFPWQFRGGLLLLSVAVGLVAGVFWATVWWRMARRAGSPIGWTDGVRVYMLSTLAKYVPGSIWGYVSRAYLGRDYGLTMMGVGVSSVWEVGCAIVASLLLTAASIPAYPARLPGPLFQLILAVALVSLVLLLPPVFNRWIRLLSRRRAAAEPPSLRWADFGLYLAAAFLTHVLVGTGFFLFASALVDLPLRAWWGFVGGWSFSATAGLVVLLAPYGLGVKEGVLTLFLQGFMPVGAAALVALASRPWVIAIELLQAAAALLLLRKSDKYSIRVIDSPPESG